MATMLKTEVDETIERSLEERDRLTGALNQNPIGEPDINNPLPTPKRILVRQFGLVAGPEGPFGYIDPDEAWTYSAAKLDQILDGLRQGHYQPNVPDEPFNRPLDLNCGDATHFILFLSNQRRWRFSRTAKAVTLGNFDEEERKNYLSLRHVVDDNAGTPAPDLNRDCKIVHFIARKTSDDFHHPFNLNIELVYTADPSGPNTIPIVIDPDVRNPGGSGEP
jgi:hypothetical protein